MTNQDNPWVDHEELTPRKPARPSPFTAFEQAYMDRAAELAKTLGLSAAIEQATQEFYPRLRAPQPTMKGPRPKLEVRGEGEGRHPMMMSEIAAMWDGNMDEDEFVEKAMEINEKYCDPPKPESKIRSQVQWVMRKEPAGQGGPKIVVGAPLTLPASAQVSGGSFDFMLGPWDGEKHGIFGTRRLHIISGASGAGKSTLAIQMLEAQAKGEPVFKRQSFGWPYLIIWQDRGKADLEEQLDNMGLLENPPPYALVTPEQVNLGPAKAVEEIYLDRKDKPKVIFIEGVDMWSDDAMDMKRVGTLCSDLLKVAEFYNLAIIFSAGSPKRKVKEGYLAVRDRVIGSSAWGRKTSTLIEVVEEQDTDHNRIVSILSRTARAQVLTMSMRNGRLEPASIEVNITEGIETGSKRDAIFSYLDARPDLTWQGVAKAFAPMAESTAMRWRAEWVKAGLSSESVGESSQ